MVNKYKVKGGAEDKQQEENREKDHLVEAKRWTKKIKK